MSYDCHYNRDEWTCKKKLKAVKMDVFINCSDFHI